MSPDKKLSRLFSSMTPKSTIILWMIFFSDPLNAKAYEPNEMNLLRLCDVHNIPLATNIATAEALIHALERGDLDWREIVRG